MLTVYNAIFFEITSLMFAFAGLNVFLRFAQTKHFYFDVFGDVLLAGLSVYLVGKYWVTPRLNWN
jgi:hypothetical protein